MLKYGILLILCLSLLCASQQPARTAGVKDGYKVPQVTVPYAWQKPVIDGTVHDDEWQGAESVNALQTKGHAISLRQTRYWMSWDEDTLYMAMRSPFRPGERPIQALRDPHKDNNVVFDDSYEIWLDVGTRSPDGQPVFFQFLSNIAGARYDVMHEPAVGNSRLGWTAGWDIKNRLTPDGRFWEWEIAIPRTSVYKDTPFVEGFQLSCLIARNFKRPWEQSSFEGTGVFAVLDTHSRYTLSKSAPSIHVLDIADPDKGSFGLKLAAYARQATTLRWTFASDGGVQQDGAVTIPAGELVTGGPGLGLDTPGNGEYRITITSADGKTTYLDWCAMRQFGSRKDYPAAIHDTGDQVSLRLEFNPISNYVRVFGDFIQYDARDTIAKYQIEVKDAAGKAIAAQELQLDELAYVQGVVPVGAIPEGKYVTTLTCLGQDGRVILSRESTFEKKDHAKSFAWWNTTHGNIEKVIAPWTPVTYANRRFGVWGRQMEIGPAGLPAQITSNGKKLLADPMKLVAELADGTQAVVTDTIVKTLSTQEHRAVIEVTGTLAGAKVKTLVTMEFDGMYKVEMTLDTKKPLAVKSLKVVVPFTNATADYIHACGEGIRYGYYYGFVSKEKTGRIWDCTTVDSQPMLVGSFIPYVWVGSPDAGLCWYADSDQGWVPNDAVPAIELRRDGTDSTDMVLNLISSDAILQGARTITFAFQASPVKKLQEQWRMDSWWCGDTFMDYSATGVIIWTAIPFTKDVEKCTVLVARRHASTNQNIFGIKKYSGNAVPYFIHQSLPANLVPEVRYFGDEWRTSVSEGLYYGKELQDYMIHHLGEWAKTCGIDGYYIDNMRPVACDNSDAGRGYRLPDGRIQPTYQMFDTRRYFLRMKAAFAEQGKEDKIVLHMTNNMILPWVQAGGIAYDGEHFVIYPEMEKDFMDLWSLERMRVDYSGQWGVAVNFMHEYKGRWTPATLAKVMRAYTGMVILHDALPSGNANGLNTPLWIGRDRFGIEANDVEFLPYWEAGTGVASGRKDVYLAAWKRPGKLLIAVVNTGEKCDATVKVDAAKLGLPNPAEWKAWDAEAGTTLKDRTSIIWDAAKQGAITTRGDGTLTVPVERHDYRLVIIEK